MTTFRPKPVALWVSVTSPALAAAAMTRLARWEAAATIPAIRAATCSQTFTNPQVALTAVDPTNITAATIILPNLMS
jgi:hypothetical protein